MSWEETHYCVAWYIRTWCPIGPACIAHTLDPRAGGTVTIVQITMGQSRRITSRTCLSCIRVGIVTQGCPFCPAVAVRPGRTRVENVPVCEVGRVSLIRRGNCSNFSEGVEDRSTIMRHDIAIVDDVRHSQTTFSWLQKRWIKALCGHHIAMSRENAPSDIQ